MGRARFAPPPIRLIMNKLQSISCFGVIVISYKILILTAKLQKIFHLCNISLHFFFYRLVSPITSPSALGATDAALRHKSATRPRLLPTTNTALVCVGAPGYSKAIASDGARRHKGDACFLSPHRKQPMAWLASGTSGNPKIS